MGISFLTFASSDWVNSPKRFKEQGDEIAARFGFFDNFWIWNEKDLDIEYQKRFSPYYKDHGFAYFSWKPYCIRQALNKLKDGDYLFYIDSGCVLPMDKLDGFLEDIRKATEDIEKNEVKFALTTYIDNNPNIKIPNIGIVKMEILKKFNLEQDERFLFYFPHYQAGIFLIKNTKENIEFLDEWYRFYEDNYESCIRGGYTDRTNQYKYFIHNGSDQAIMQCLLYTRKMTPHNINFIYDYKLIQHRLG